MMHRKGWSVWGCLWVGAVATLIHAGAARAGVDRTANGTDRLSDGVPQNERWVYSDPPGGGPDGPRRDILIVDNNRPIAFFGFYRTSQMTQPGWELFDRAVDWVNDFRDPATTRVWLATYRGTLDPRSGGGEPDGIAVYERLTTVLGFDPANIRVEPQASIETGNFAGYDFVLYAWIFPRDATNVLNQGMPFLTFSAGETDELGIGTGVNTMHEWRDNAFVIDSQHSITQTFAVGEITLAANMWMDASEVAGTGVALVNADGLSLIKGDMNCDGSINGADIDPFFLALGDPAGYAAMFPNCDVLSGDMNGDGLLNGADIDPFFVCLGGGFCP